MNLFRINISIFFISFLISIAYTQENYRDFGKYIYTCNRTYMLAYNDIQTTREKAIKLCEALGLKLASIETEDERDCIKDAIDVPLDEKSFWVSATCTPPNCPKTFVWMTGGTVPKSFWKINEPNGGGANETATVLFLNEFQMEDVAEVDRYDRPLCEGSGTVPSVVLPEESCRATCRGELTDTNRWRIARNPNDEGHLLTDLGDVLVKCDRVYFMSELETSHYEATLFCIGIGMSLLSLESMVEAECLADNFRAYRERAIGTEFWTSAWNGACHDKNYVWCPIEKPVPLAMWEKDEPNDANFDEACGFINLETQRMSDYTCSSNKYFICESDDVENIYLSQYQPPQPTSTRRPLTCGAICSEYDQMTEEEIKEMKDSQKDGSEDAFFDSCDKEYLISQRAFTQEDAHIYCVSKQMILLSIETKEEEKCLIRSIHEYSILYKSFWVSATDKGCPDYYRWCNRENNETLFSNLVWLRNKQDKPQTVAGEKKCISINYYIPDVSFVFDIKSCDTKLYVLCERQEKGIPMATPKPPVVLTTTKPTTTIKKGCNRYCLNNILADPKKTITTKTPRTTVTVCSKQHAASGDKFAAEFAMNYCESQKMKIITVDTLTKLNCLTNALAGDKKLNTYTFWTSGNDRDCNGRFSWCPGTEVSKDLWATSNPDKNPDKRCVTLKILSGKAKLFNDYCGASNYILCEPK